jgi:cytochrome c
MSCAKGGPNGVGPNLYRHHGQAAGHVAGFGYSAALKEKPGVWDWANMNSWLANPKAYAPGTKMTFAGLSKPEDRANVIAYLNTSSDSPAAAAGGTRRGGRCPCRFGQAEHAGRRQLVGADRSTGRQAAGGQYPW